MIHHAIRRDLRRFTEALASITPDRVDELRASWVVLRDVLHSHHEREDEAMFPATRDARPELAAAIDTLSAQHAKLTPLIERGNAAFTSLPLADDARDVIAEMCALLDDHFDLEEATVIPVLRHAKQWPAPPSDDLAEQFADAFAWCLLGIAPAVCAKLEEILAPSVVAKLPTARAKFAAQYAKAWGDVPITASTTSIPS